ncbi:hypothetical protein [Rickettsia endosymbiont of Culicoides newsteadi]|uniref:hypothetical protein n=1 Tax=Rickettsia endosymbiont of Culicoides newsteadi TaxID=1961830 RepID=UPI001054CEEA|nr:hypothetical protein [Rickettsia endosymbiont of Culicoides newsteadi]
MARYKSDLASASLRGATLVATKQSKKTIKMDWAMLPRNDSMMGAYSALIHYTSILTMMLALKYNGVEK